MNLKSLGATLIVLVIALIGAYGISLIGEMNLVYMEVKEFGFKIRVPSNLRDEIYYKVEDKEYVPDSGDITTEVDFLSKQGDCNLGVVTKWSENNGLEESAPGFFGACMDGGRCLRQFDGFSLVYGGPQAVSCDFQYEEIERKTRQAVQDGFKKVELIR